MVLVPCYALSDWLAPRLVRVARRDWLPAPLPSSSARETGDRGDALAVVSGVGGCEVASLRHCFILSVSPVFALDFRCLRRRRRQHQRKLHTTLYFGSVFGRRRCGPPLRPCRSFSRGRLGCFGARAEETGAAGLCEPSEGVEIQVAPSVGAAVKRVFSARESCREGEGAKPNATLLPPSLRDPRSRCLQPRVLLRC